MMWLKILCVVVVASNALGAQDELLVTMYGVEGRNQVSVCVWSESGRWRRCDGALYLRELVVVRSHCIATAPAQRLFIERLSAGGSCDQFAAGYTGVYRSRAVRELVLHPWYDIALVIARTPYNDLDQLANATSTEELLREYGVHRWMQKYFKKLALTRNHRYQMQRIARHLKSHHNPLWLFLTTMVTPTVLFMMFFVYVTFYTGTPQAVPYKKMPYSKKVTHV